MPENLYSKSSIFSGLESQPLAPRREKKELYKSRNEMINQAADNISI